MSKPTESNNSYTVKLIIIGDSGVGKTNLLMQYCDSEFKINYVPTIGVDFKIKTVNLDGCKLKLQIWDTAGQERFKTVNQAYYKGSAGIVMVYSMTDPSSFENIESWIKQVNEFTGPEVRKVLVANKLDMVNERKVTHEAGKRCATRYGIEYFEVSARDGTNVNDVFNEISKQIKLVLELEENVIKKTYISLKGYIDQDKNCKC